MCHCQIQQTNWPRLPYCTEHPVKEPDGSRQHPPFIKGLLLVCCIDLQDPLTIMGVKFTLWNSLYVCT